MLTQEHGNKHTVACNLIQWAYAYPSHLKTTAATTKLVEVSTDVTPGNAIIYTLLTLSKVFLTLN